MAVFGMESSCIGAPDGSRHCGTVCLDRAATEENTFHGIRNGDFIFIKAYTPQTGLDLKAVGVVRPGLPLAEGHCIPVEWVWAGDKHVSDLDDCCPLRSRTLYEEYNLAVQREVLDLLPTSLRPALP
jgi:hypothetical protein